MSCPEDLLTIVILAGGRGGRLDGRDKGLLKWQGKPFIEHILDRIEPVTKHILINANRNIDSYRQYDYPVLSDETSNYDGPLAGMLVALKKVKTPYILTIPCDAPSVAPSIVERFCRVHEVENELLYVASTDDGLQPVYAMINTSLADNLAQYLAEGNRKTQDWMKVNDAVIVSFDQQITSFMNVNTEEDMNNLC